MELLIETLLPAEGHVPINGTDTNGRTYTEWELSDEASFDFALPSTYTTGESIVMVITESSSSASKNHKWRWTTSTGSYSESYDASFTSNATASTIDTRSITVTTAGTIESYALQPGDLIGVTIQRIAADSDEDSAGIRLYTIVANVTTTAGATTACLGRMGSIVASALRLFNDDSQRFINDAFCVSAANEAQRQIAMKGYFTKSSSIDVVADQATYALAALFPDIEELNTLVWVGDGSLEADRLAPVASLQSKIDLIAASSSSSRAYGYHLEGTTLYLIPVPTASYSAGITVYYSYIPSDLSCTSSYTPSTPAAHDAMYRYFILMEAYARDRHSPMAQQQLMYYQQLFSKELDRLLGTKYHPGDRLRSYR